MDIKFVRADKHRRDYKNLKKLYHEAFPPEERAPFRLLARKADRPGVDFWSILDGRKWVGLMYVVSSGELSYVFYFAISPDLRGQGIGSAALRLAMKHYSRQKFFLAIEPPDPEASNAEERITRKRFYLNSGMTELGTRVKEGTVEFELLGNGKHVSGDEYLSVFRAYFGRISMKLIKVAADDPGEKNRKENALMNTKSEFEGAYIPADHTYGLRLEITGDRFLLLWRNSPVLDTTMKTSADGSAVSFILADSRLRHSPGSEPYAEITSCRVENGQIVLTEFFPITGESVTVLAPTEESRYGDVDIVTDEYLPLLQGHWKQTGTANGLELNVRGRVLTAWDDDHRDEIAVVRPRWSTGSRVNIVNLDPSKDTVAFLCSISYENGILRAVIPVCDAPSTELEFIKTEK